jgi:hypothetical protein
MKKILTIAIIILTSMIAQAQYSYTPNTYYLIPPTNGCNGLWALQDTCHYYPTYTWTGGCGQPQTWHMNGDTLFVPLCSFPCSITGTTQSANICLHATCSQTTGITEYNNTKELDITWQDHYTFILKNTQDDFDKVAVVSMTGQVIIEMKSLNRNENITFNTNNWANGLYIIKTFKNGGMVSVKKLIKD